MSKNLRQVFPGIRNREEVLADISRSQLCQRMFDGWRKEQQDHFLDICTGARGVNITYDPFFKEVFNPEYNPDRLNDLLSILLNEKVKIIGVLPNDSIRLGIENTLLITDIVVELANGSIANIEIQKIGYMFPGERAACYSADLLLRQYKRMRDIHKKNFKYGNIKSVYTIVFFENSPKEFYDFPEHYIHYADTKFDTGVNINLLQKYIFIPLDIFKKIHHNKPISSKTDAWLMFLSSDSPEDIARLIEDYPCFKPLYEDIYEMCQNTEDIMGLFSKELQMLDENTMQFMIDTMQDELEDLKAERKKCIDEIVEMDHTIAEQTNTIAEQSNTIEELKRKLARYES